MPPLDFALNHMTAPALKLDAFFALAVSLGMTKVEIRNDLNGNAILDGTAPAEVKALAERHGVTIISINALQRFNEWTPARAAEAKELIAGYTLIEVPSREAAIEWVKTWPRLDGHGNVEIEIRQLFTAEDFGEAYIEAMASRGAASGTLRNPK